MTDIIKEQNRLRQLKFYEKNKERILEQKKLKRQQKKQPVEEPIEQPVEKPVEQPVEQQLDIVIKKPKKKSLLDINKVLEMLQTLRDLGKIKTDGTLKAYISHTKQLFKLVNCDDFKKCLKDTKLIIEKIDTSTFSLNTQKSLYQIIIYLIDNLKLGYSKKVFEEYKHKFEVFKLKSVGYTKEKAKESVMTFDEYLEKVKTHFGDKSMMYVLMLLYGIDNTFRDDFQLQVVKFTRDAELDKSKNYLVLSIPRMRLIMNVYKTVGIHGQQKIMLPNELSKTIKDYIKENKIQVGNYLFGEKKLSNWIRMNNLQIGIQGGIDLIRKMKFSDIKKVTGELTAEQQIETAKNFQHSVNAQINYTRN